jgi:hypothetical protein
MKQDGVGSPSENILDTLNKHTTGFRYPEDIISPHLLAVDVSSCLLNFLFYTKETKRTNKITPKNQNTPGIYKQRQTCR